MDMFDQRVAGYESTKDILRRILDVLKRPATYRNNGASIPRGLLMKSPPGLGKSLLASVFMEESGREAFIFRKDSEDNAFLDELKSTFSAARDAAPSILLLEDLNLYVESNSPYAPEWACLQACIDNSKDTDIFVIATTNDTSYMPQSLLRPGRFDYVIELCHPKGKTAEDVVSYYLKGKNLAEDVQISDIVKAMPEVSCAALETVMNIAALNQVYQGHDRIEKSDITDALLQVVYELKRSDQELASVERQMIAGHEAAHAVVGEILHPGSIGIVTIRGRQDGIGGLENSHSYYLMVEEDLFDNVIKALAGKAGVALLYGEMDISASRDIQKANLLLDFWVTQLAGGGFAGIEPRESRASEITVAHNENMKEVKMNELYRKAFKILHDNKEFLLAVQKALLEHETLLSSDLDKIRISSP